APFLLHPAPRSCGHRTLSIQRRNQRLHRVSQRPPNDGLQIVALRDLLQLREMPVHLLVPDDAVEIQFGSLEQLPFIRRGHGFTPIPRSMRSWAISTARASTSSCCLIRRRASFCASARASWRPVTRMSSLMSLASRKSVSTNPSTCWVSVLFPSVMSRTLFGFPNVRNPKQHWQVDGPSLFG